jgi:hypothetical protein
MNCLNGLIKFFILTPKIGFVIVTALKISVFLWRKQEEF